MHLNNNQSLMPIQTSLGSTITAYLVYSEPTVKFTFIKNYRIRVNINTYIYFNGCNCENGSSRRNSIHLNISIDNRVLAGQGHKWEA